LAKFATVKAIKDFVAASIKFLKVFREWDAVWQYRPNDPCFYHGVGYCANPDDIPAKGESPETHPTKWNIIGGAESGATFTPTPNRVTKFDPDSRLRSGGYAFEPDHVITKKEINRRVTTLQLYGKESLLMSNAGQILRRLRGFDLGVPYLSNLAEIYHFDTDALNQYQEPGVSITAEGDATRFVGKNDLLDGLPLVPAIVSFPPHEVVSKSILGNFSVTKNIPASENSTVEFWARLFAMNNNVLFRIGTPADTVVLLVGLGDPEYCAAGSDEDVEYCVPGEENIPYSTAKTMGSVLEHRTPNGVETIVLDATGTDPVYDVPAEIPYSLANPEDPEYSVACEHGALADIPEKEWLHVAVVNRKTVISVFITDKRFDFTKYSVADQPVTAVINETLDDFNLDELYIDGGAALDFEDFVENTRAKLPYAALSCREKWFVLEAEDVNKVKTNLFETQEFKTAVRAVINNL